STQQARQPRHLFAVGTAYRATAASVARPCMGPLERDESSARTRASVWPLSQRPVEHGEVLRRGTTPPGRTWVADRGYLLRFVRDGQRGAASADSHSHGPAEHAVPSIH